VAKLVVNPTSANRREIALGRTLVSIGRDPSNDLVLPDAMVSRRHAVIECRGAQYYLRDCNSSNGSVVNGDRVSEKGLRDGDLVAIGSARLLFKEEAEATAGTGSGKVVPHPSAPRLACPGCEAQYRKGDVFCRSCGARLPEPSGPPKLVCGACGTAVLLPAQFCNACGARLPEAALAPSAEAAPLEAPEVTSPSPRPRSQGALAQAASEAMPQPHAGASALAAPSAVPGESAPGPIPAAVPEKPKPLAASPAAAARPLSGPAPVSARPGPAAVPSPSSSVTAPAPLPAPPLLRGLAALLDLGLITLAEAVIVIPLASYWWAREQPQTPAEVAFTPVLLSLIAAPLALLGVAAYYVWSWGVRGATTGQRLLDLMVTGEDGRFPIGSGRAALRLFGYLLSVLSLGVGFLLVPLTGLGLHDRIAGTRVVRRGSR